ncbi:MAG: NADH-quinone oxidoreductase subunit D [Verrucomicrobia bacterium]|nr:NADH-quinone oxidoreductase subunit D [Verrucomicrobiota bacterium]
MAIKIVVRRPLTFAERTYLPQIIAGLKVTWDNMMRPPVTLQYPDERPAIPKNYRGVPTLVADTNIRITPGEISETSDNAHVEKAPKEFEINMLRCIYCGLCQEVCPEEAIFLQSQYSLTGLTRESMVNNKAKLYELGGTLPDNHHKWDKKKEEAEKQAGGQH